MLIKVSELVMKIVEEDRRNLIKSHSAGGRWLSHTILLFWRHL